MGWNRIEYWGGLCELGENKERTCIGWDRIERGHAWAWIELGDGMHGVGG